MLMKYYEMNDTDKIVCEIFQAKWILMKNQQSKMYTLSSKLGKSYENVQ